MYRHHRWLDDTSDDAADRRRTGGLAGIAIILLLLIGGLFLVQRLHTATLIEDCLMSGRRNCDVLLAGQR